MPKVIWRDQIGQSFLISFLPGLHRRMNTSRHVSPGCKTRVGWEAVGPFGSRPSPGCCRGVSLRNVEGSNAWGAPSALSVE